MEVKNFQPNFGRFRLGKITPVGVIHIPSNDVLEQLTQNADVFIKSCQRVFPYNNKKIRAMECSALKISARPKNLSFLEKLFNKKTVTEYFPVENMKAFLKFDPNKTLVDVISEVVSKVS